ncbi:Uncharacterized protein TCM_021964 [Theobroma cacao]|uniref:RNase H type-1 domain-containing protein n=1 Tax=Theobroma cacao TaxID=3641 RepID=A0A061ET30_THECC|nr:Uncharacterized protein TCM_021964 [Theobroma cacao]
MAFYAIVWSVWLYRNDTVFRRVTWNVDQVFDLLKQRVATWAPAKWHHEYGVVLDTERYPAEGTVIKRRMRTRIVEEWSKPRKGEMKYNVDGAAPGCPGKVGIGGIMRDEEGNTKIVFSKAIGVEDASVAEVRAVREAFLTFAGSKLVATYSLIIESDSKNAVKWTNKPSEAPRRLRKWILHIERLKKEEKKWVMFLCLCLDTWKGLYLYVLRFNERFHDDDGFSFEGQPQIVNINESGVLF